MVEADATRASRAELLLLSSLGDTGGGTEQSTATLRAAQFKSARYEGEISGRSERRVRRMTEKPLCSHRLMGESFLPVEEE